MTNLYDITILQSLMRQEGCIVTLFFKEGGELDDVFLINPNGKGLSKSGRIMSALSFAEYAREYLDSIYGRELAVR